VPLALLCQSFVTRSLLSVKGKSFIGLESISGGRPDRDGMRNGAATAIDDWRSWGSGEESGPGPVGMLSERRGRYLVPEKAVRAAFAFISRRDC
jgi:hypothetical protein